MRPPKRFFSGGVPTLLFRLATTFARKVLTIYRGKPGQRLSLVLQVLGHSLAFHKAVKKLVAF